MRATLILCALAACGGPSGPCETNDECSGSDVCARNGECLSPSDVHSVRLTWTVGGQSASSTTCARHPSLEVFFYNADDYNDAFGFSPVPCAAGVFTIDRLPLRYTSAQLDSQEKAITGGEVMFDLPP